MQKIDPVWAQTGTFRRAVVGYSQDDGDRRNSAPGARCGWVQLAEQEINHGWSDVRQNKSALFWLAVGMMVESVNVTTRRPPLLTAWRAVSSAQPALFKGLLFPRRGCDDTASFVYTARRHVEKWALGEMDAGQPQHA